MSGFFTAVGFCAAFILQAIDIKLKIILVRDLLYVVRTEFGEIGEKMKHKTNIAALALGLALWASAGVAGAATSLLNDSLDNLTVSGYSNSGTGGALQAKSLTWWSGSGYGMYSPGESGSPQHSVDNSTYQESLLLNFGQSTTLESVTIGWKDTDADITVLAWKPDVAGAAAPVFSSTTKYSDLLGLGWDLVGHYANLAAGSAKSVNVSNPVSSSYWLVLAYNNSFGSTKTDTSSSTYGLNSGNDYMKFLSVSYSTPTPPDNKVPEPSTALLLGAAMFGLVGWRNRRNAVR
ncbi:MAG: PEP-CTERM sorting domain-containing protein [Dechloromonas sp.]|nr:MAG: PEP-CTERM sorting domain-containing protein [Dechloromonas sp.]